MPEWVLQLIGPGIMAAGVYAAIRADLASLHERARAHHDRLTMIETRIFK